MLNSISISNFKTIQDKEISQEQFNKLEGYEIDEREGKFYQKRPLILDNLTKVNYLVGPNGCGKSSIGIYLQDIFIDLNIFRKKIDEKLKKKLDSYLRAYSFRSRIRAKVNNENSPHFLPGNSLDFREKRFLKINFIPNPNYDKGEYFNRFKLREFIDLKFIYQNFREIYFKHIYGILNEKTKETEKITKETKEISNKILNYFYDKIKVSPQVYSNLPLLNCINLSSGEANIQHWTMIIYLIKKEKIDLVFLEEPETSLHPEWQKVIPGFVKIMSEFCPNTQFIISTHSPFIISAAGEIGDQNVYIIKEGEVMDKNEKKKSESGFEDEAEKGYHGTQIASVVAKMLGAEGTDLGYPENFCILEESSLGTILEHCAEKGFIKNWRFISANSNSNINSFVKNLKEFSKNLHDQAILLFTNPFYKDNFCVIVDSLNDHELTENKKITEQFLEFKRLLGQRFIKLEKTELEYYYKNLDQSLYDEFYLETDKEKRQKTKGSFAKKIAKKIKTPQDFQRLFNKELDSLLKPTN